MLRIACNSVFSVFARVICVALLFWALDKHPYEYFTILRWVTFLLSAYLGYLSYRQKRSGWIWAFVVLVLLFNPFVPARFGRDTWKILDVGAGVVMLLSIFFLREQATVGRVVTQD